MNGYKNIKTVILAGLLAASLVVPASALEGSMGPARMTLRTEVPFMSQGVIEVPIRVCNTANESESVRLFTTDDLNNSDIMTVEFTEQQLVLMPEEERVLNVTFRVKKTGTFSGNIGTLFNSMTEESSSSPIGSSVGLRINSKVSIIAESKGPDISLYGAVGLAGIVLLILLVLNNRKKSNKKEEKQKESANEK